MKKIIYIIASLCLICLLCSCEGEKDTGVPIDNTELSVTDIIGETEEIPYESFLDNELFVSSYESYTDTMNPLQLKGGPYEDAVVVKPFKSVLVDEDKVVEQLNIWMYPVVHDNKYIGFINCDMRNLKTNNPVFFGGESFAPTLNDALEKGDIALFNTIDGTYGIYEDNTIITLESDKEYNGSITYEQVNQTYNLITSSSSNNTIYSHTKE